MAEVALITIAVVAVLCVALFVEQRQWEIDGQWLPDGQSWFRRIGAWCGCAKVWLIPVFLLGSVVVFSGYIIVGERPSNVWALSVCIVLSFLMAVAALQMVHMCASLGLFKRSAFTNWVMSIPRFERFLWYSWVSGTCALLLIAGLAWLL